MPVTETDLELLENYLDDALESAQVEALRARLTDDQDLRAAMEQIRHERATRKAFFTTLEPDDATADALAARIRAAIYQRRRFASIAAPLRYFAAAAACVAIGFFARGFFDHGPRPTNETQNAPITATYQVTLRDQSGKVVAVQRFDSLQKAQEFAADLARWQSHSERLATGRFVLTTDRF
jgi:anti-sigma factor RsiW